MTFSEYCYGPLHDVLNELQGDYPPDDHTILRVILARCVAEVIALRDELTRMEGSK